MQGQCDGGKGMKFEAQLKALPKGGRLSGSGDTLRVDGADEVVLLLAAATDHVLDPAQNYRGKDPAALCQKHLAAASSKAFDALQSDHVAEHQRLFRRMDLDLGRTPAAELPTDKRLESCARAATTRNSSRSISNTAATC